MTEGTISRTAHDALTGCGFQPNLDLSKEDVELRLNGWRIALVGNCELGAVIAVHDGPSCGVPHVVCGSVLSKVESRIANA